MLAMNYRRHARDLRTQKTVKERLGISSVDDVSSSSAKQSCQFQWQQKIMASARCHVMNSRVACANTRREFSDATQATNRRAKVVWIQTVHDIDDAILETTGLKAEHNVVDMNFAIQAEPTLFESAIPWQTGAASLFDPPSQIRQLMRPWQETPG